MTDQFSPEYIDYILSDEAKGLQKPWKPRVGDRRVAPDESTVPALITCQWETTKTNLRSRGDVFWLPTLWDLLQIIEARWPFIDCALRPTEDEIWPRVHIWAAAECVTWQPEGSGFWRCEECGDDLHEQDDGSVTYGSFPEDISDEAYDRFDSGRNLPICPHCGWSEGKDLMLAAAKLAVRALKDANRE